MSTFTFKMPGDQDLVIFDMTTGPATKRANDHFTVKQKKTGSWLETSRNEFTWQAMQPTA